MSTAKHPMQPLIVNIDGVVRFKVNKIVRLALMITKDLISHQKLLEMPQEKG
jgi:hypothetical protein